MLAPNNTLQNGRYRIVRRIGQGGMGAVYEAVDERLSNQVAIKEALVHEPALRQAFEKEAKRLARLRHSGLPNVIDHFTESSGGQYLVMEFIEGKDLAQMLKGRGQPFPVEQVMAWGKRLLETLDYLHQEGVIHRDIKPANIKLTSKGELVLLDFGLAKGGLTRHTLAGMSLKGYTPGFASPEQVRFEPTDARSDLYSLAATLYALLTNEIPDEATSRKRYIERGYPDPLRPANEINPQVPPHIAETLTRAMALEPNQRPASAKEMLGLLSAPPPPTSAYSLPKPVNPSTLRHASRQGTTSSGQRPQPTWLPWALGTVAAVLLVVIVVGLATMMSGGNGNGEEELANVPKSTATMGEVAVIDSPTTTVISEPSPIPTATVQPSSTPTATIEPSPIPTATG